MDNGILGQSLATLTEKINGQTKLLEDMNAEIKELRRWRHDVVSPTVQVLVGKTDEISGPNGSISILRKAIEDIVTSVSNLQKFMWQFTGGMALIGGLATIAPVLLHIVKAIRT